MRAFNAEATFTTDEGETLHFLCDFYALDVIEQVTGERWDDIIPQLASPPRALGVKVLYGLLRGRQPNITLDEVAALSFDKNSIALWATVGDVIRRANNLAEPDDEPEPSKKKPSGRSRRSARNG